MKSGARDPVPEKLLHLTIALSHPTNEVEKMKTSIRGLSACVALALSAGSTMATAAETITLMQFSDLHGKMVPHQEIFEGDRAQN